MALASMTGFARATSVVPLGSLAWEIKTVNAKGLDIRVRTPAGFDAQEAAFRARIGALMHRGTCQAVLSVQRPPQTPEIRVDRALLRSLLDAVDGALPPGSAIAPASLDGLLAIRGVVEISEPVEAPEDRAELAAEALRVLDSALAQLRSVREAEGTALGTVLAAQVERIGVLIETAERAPGRTPQAARERLERAVATLIDAVPALDPTRLHQEAILIAARADVQEELDRLAIHRQAVAALLREGGPIGRRLDFLAQELGREANTLCAKSADAGLTTIGLDLRGQIEQFREQVQNLE